jgi:deazaflavin-dependent oxidoreductase (nitroreductase family)
LFRLPAWLYRARLGFLAGHRFLLLTHRGRQSGRLYDTPLEVVRYDPARREATVISAWGDAADWYRNVRANPVVRARIAGEDYQAHARFLDREETIAVLREYARRHPGAARLAPAVLGWNLLASEADLAELAGRVRAVAFSPHPHRPAAP